MEFSDKIEKELLRVDFSASGKEDALRKMAALAAGSPRMPGFGEQFLYDKLMEREASVSTGIGKGIAIPHARLPGLEDFVVMVLVSPKGVEFDALDKKRVNLFFVVFAPEGRVNEHLALLASISRAMSGGNLKKEILATRSAEVLHEIITRATHRETPVPRSDRKKLLVVILYYEDDLRAVLEFLLDQDIKGATILPSQGMGAYVSSMPLFASFLGFMNEHRNASFTLLTLIPEGREQLFVEGIENITGDLDKTMGAMVMILDVPFFKGTMSML